MARIKHDKNLSKRQFIIERAAELFKTKGYTTASMRDIANVVGVEAPSLYNHIGSKSEILRDICFKVGNEFTAKMLEVEDSNSPSLIKIETIIRFHIKQMLENFNEVFIANHEWKHLEDFYLAEFILMRKEYERKFMDIIEKGIETKEILSVNSYVTVLTVLSAIRGIEFWKRNKNNVSAYLLEEEMVTHLLKGILK